MPGRVRLDREEKTKPMNHLLRLALVFLAAVPEVAGADATVVVYNWSEYIPEAVLEQFTEETGIGPPTRSGGSTSWCRT